jgi:glycosyltransferase involved in cell wall biosynthesis
MIVDGAEGRILPADDEDAWSEALLALAADEPRRLALAAAGQRRAMAEHRPESMLQAFERRLRLAAG